MVKPREFWIVEYQLGDEPFNAEVFNYKMESNALHVREVIPIDWDKIWEQVEKEYDEWGYHGNAEYQIIIQQVLEKKLSGEE